MAVGYQSGDCVETQWIAAGAAWRSARRCLVFMRWRGAAAAARRQRCDPHPQRRSARARAAPFAVRQMALAFVLLVAPVAALGLDAPRRSDRLRADAVAVAHWIAGDAIPRCPARLASPRVQRADSGAAPASRRWAQHQSHGRGRGASMTGRP